MTNGVRVLGSRALRLSVPQRIVLLTGCVAAVAVALFVIVVRSLPAAPTALTLPGVLWVAVFAVSEVLVVHVQWQREAHTFSVGDLVLAAGLLLAVPHQLVVAQVVGCGLSLVLHRRQRGIKLAFNVAQYALGGALATTVFVTLTGPLGLWDWPAALVAITVSTVTADLCIFAVISISEGRVRFAPLKEMLALSLTFTMGAASVGLVLARTAIHDPSALALLALPSFLIVAAYRAYTGAPAGGEPAPAARGHLAAPHGRHPPRPGGLPRLRPLGLPRRDGRARAGGQGSGHGQPQPGRLAGRGDGAAGGLHRARPPAAPRHRIRDAVDPHRQRPDQEPGGVHRWPRLPRRRRRRAAHRGPGARSAAGGRPGRRRHHLLLQRRGPAGDLRPARGDLAGAWPAGGEPARGHRPQGATPPPGPARLLDRSAQPGAVPGPREAGRRGGPPHAGV